MCFSWGKIRFEEFSVKTVDILQLCWEVNKFNIRENVAWGQEMIMMQRWQGSLKVQV